MSDNHTPDKTEISAVLLTTVFIIALCGIFYELLISSISTYFLGSGVLHFSITIGLFMSFMGVGSFLSRYVSEPLLEQFIRFEIWLGAIGGCSAFILHFSYSLTENYYLIAFTLIALLGTLIGLEIPLLTRLSQPNADLKDVLANVLSFDYLGALVASILFPLFLLPYLGIMKTSFVIGLINLLIAAFNCFFFRFLLVTWKKLLLICFIWIVMLSIGLAYSFELTGFFEKFVYQDEVIFSEQSSYQRIVVTKWNEDYRLFLNGNLQFSSIDEHRYHEPLVHIPAALTPQLESVLILGGGDGLAAREIFRHYPHVKQVDLVDLDPKMTQIASQNPIFLKINEKSLQNSKLRIFNDDAYNFIRNGSSRYSLIIIDLPDPNDTGLGKLYTTEFYHLVAKRLSADGVMVTQSTSPYFAPMAFWCIHHTLKEVFPEVIPYQVYVPSFGQWGFNLAIASARKQISKEERMDRLQKQLFADSTRKQMYRYLNPESMKALFCFDNDIQEIETPPNTLDTQILVKLYEESEKNWH
ncbi:MAG: polyamine aminopropyltransferase [Bacteroidia bacterium]|nr:polyamine aminopropyltransferase [Bacteroidia bacterium]